jgi:hypothetical protein
MSYFDFHEKKPGVFKMLNRIYFDGYIVFIQIKQDQEEKNLKIQKKLNQKNNCC